MNPMQHLDNPHFDVAPHFDDDTLDAALIGDLSATAAAHLEACELCAGRVAEARLPLASFRDVAVAWSERRSATLPVALPARRRTSSAGYAWSAAATAMLAIAIAVPVALHSRENAPQDHASMQPLPPQAGISAEDSATYSEVASEAEVAQDNQLLSAVDSELVANSAESSSALGLETVPSHRTRQIFTVDVQD